MQPKAPPQASVAAAFWPRNAGSYHSARQPNEDERVYKSVSDSRDADTLGYDEHRPRMYGNTQQSPQDGCTAVAAASQRLEPEPEPSGAPPTASQGPAGHGRDSSSAGTS